MALPEFLTDGRPVVELFSNAVHPVEIIRTTATQVIIRDHEGRERRFRTGYGRVFEVGKNMYESSRLVPADDPQVLGVRRAKTIDHARGSIKVAAEARAFYGHGDLTDLIDAIAKVRDEADKQYRVLTRMVAES